MSMTGPQKTAVLCLALGEKFTGEVFKRLDRKEIARISKAMMEMETVPKEQVDTSQQAGLAKNVKVISVQGDTRSVTPSDIAIICVEGSAFLYINKDVAYTGNPTLARFTEQDAKCKGA